MQMTASNAVKVRAAITWVGVAGGKDFIESLNPNSLKVVTAIVEPSLANATAGQQFQFERIGYFVADRVDHVQGSKPVFNLAVGLKDSWGK
jgi:glutaminyl-tRNA synthetase